AQDSKNQISKDTLDPKQKEKHEKLEQKAQEKGGFARFIHRLTFRPIRKKNTQNLPAQNKISFKNFEGKIIRNIHITTLDPFGFSESDTVKKPKRWSERAGNNLPVKTRSRTIRNLLLYKKNETLDSLEI